MPDTDSDRARLVGINHVAIEVGDLDDALDFYGGLFEFDLRGRTEGGAFLDMGDQFLSLSAVEEAGDRDDHRHVGLVVDDAAALERRLEDLDVEFSAGPEFRDPWGNRVQVVAYEGVQFTKADHVRRGMDLPALEKSADALVELAEKGMAPD